MQQYWLNHTFPLLGALLVVLPLTLCTLLQEVPVVYASSQITEYGFHFASQHGPPSKKQLAFLMDGVGADVQALYLLAI